MKSRWSASPAQRARRKQDLLLASQLMRLHADAALLDLGDRVDTWADRVAFARQALRSFGTRPATATAAGALGIAVMALRRHAGRSREAAQRGGVWVGAWSAGWAAWRMWRTWRRWQGLRRR
jgi:hypothetical protein